MGNLRTPHKPKARSEWSHLNSGRSVENAPLKKGGKETKWPHTVHMGNCEYCGAKNVTMIPIRDFKWPKDKK